jgi:hypothetical protein
MMLEFYGRNISRPHGFNIMRRLLLIFCMGMEVLKIGGQIIQTVKYADDLVLRLKKKRC